MKCHFDVCGAIDLSSDTTSVLRSFWSSDARKLEEVINFPVPLKALPFILNFMEFNKLLLNIPQKNYKSNRYFR
jgi:hypothetical protein